MKDRIGTVGEMWEDTDPGSFTVKDRIGTVETWVGSEVRW